LILSVYDLEFQEFEGGVKFSVQVKPNSRKTELIVETDGTLRMNVAAPPYSGKANREIVRWLAKRLRRPSSEVRLIGGLRSRIKIIAVLNIKLDELQKGLNFPCVSFGVETVITQYLPLYSIAKFRVLRLCLASREYFDMLS